MSKQEFINHITNQYKCTKTEAEKVINMFTSSVIDAIGQGKQLSLIGFGNFTIGKIPARTGRNPRTGAAVRHVARQEIISLAS